jgi:hypothetical protein
VKTAIALVALAIATPASAAWHRVDTPNFVVVGDVGTRDLRDTAIKLEGFREGLRRLFPGVQTTAPVPTVVIVFPNNDAFTPFKPTYQGKPREVAGYAAPGLEMNFIAMISASTVSDRVIFHELTHLVIGNAMAGVPLWLNEGLAEFYSTFTLMNGGKRAQIGLPIPEHLHTLNGSIPQSLPTLLTVDMQSPLYNEGARVSTFYAESWALTHMLINGRPSRADALVTYLTRLREGAPAARTWEEIFGTARTEQDFRVYVRSPLFNTMLIDFAEKIDTLAATERPISVGDGAALLASLQLRARQTDQAATRVTAALESEPANPLLNTVMARVEHARDNPAAAEKRLLELGASDDWLVAYMAGVTLVELNDTTRGGFAGARMAESILAAQRYLGRVRTDHGDVAHLLALVAMLDLLRDDEPSAEALASIARARDLAPGRFDYSYTQAELFLKARRFADARNTLGPLMTEAFPPAARDVARRLMAYAVEVESLSRGIAPRASPSNRPVAVPGAPPDPSAPQGPPRAFTPAYRVLDANEHRLEGVLERIDCPAGGPAVFHIRGADTITLAEGRMPDVEFISYRDDLTGGVSCGPREPMRVYVTWSEGPPPRREKIVVAVEFLQKN